MDLEPAKQYIHDYGYWAIAVGTLWDQSGLQAFVVCGGIIASVTKSMTLWGVALSGAAGSFISDAILFAVGRWRARWLERVMKSEKNRMRLVVLQQGMRRWGFWLLTLGRFLPWMGRFVPAAAGLRRYPMGTALTYAALGSVASGFGYAALGYYAAESLTAFEDYALYIGIAALVISVPIAGWLLKRFDVLVQRRLEADKAAGDAEVKLGGKE